MLKDQTKGWVREFLQDAHTYKYPQPVVAEAIKEKQTSLNTWRKDGVLWGDGWEKDGRVMYTPSGLIAAGLMAEFSWAFGPKKAAQLVSEQLNWIMTLQDDVDCTFADRVVYVPRVGPSEVTVTFGDSKTVYQHDGSDPMLLPSTLEHMKDRDLRNGSVVIFPLGPLIVTWALRTLSIMDRQERRETV